MHSRQQAQAFVQPPPPLPPNTQVRCRRRGKRQVTKYSRMWRPRPHCCIWSTTHIPNTICRCTLGTGSPRRCCRHKQPPPWAARPPRPGLPAAPERGPRAPPGDSDAPDELPTPVTCANPRGRRSRSRLRSATRTPRQHGQYYHHAETSSGAGIHSERTRSAETTAQRAQSEHTAVATATTIASTASAQRSQQCASGENDMHARVGQSAVLLLPVLCCEQRARSEPVASPQRAAASPQRAVFGERC